VILSLLLGCLSPPPEDPALTDSRAYADAIKETDAQRALALCNQITDVSMNGECTMFAARQIAQTGGNATPVCEGLRQGWREVCLFEIVDASGLRGEAAASACQGTGGFKERCLAHALQREERPISEQYPPGQEAEMMAYIRTRVTLYGLDGLTQEAIDEKMAARIITERVLRSGRPRGTLPMSRSFCGTASDAVCVESYRIYVTKAGGPGRVPKDCTLPMNPERVSAVGLPTWTAEFQPLADEAWGHLCKRANTSQHHRPDHGK
jgi:hypothetical protein